MLQPFIDVLLWAIVLAVVFTPIHRRIEARLQRPSLSAAISTLLVVVTILGPATFITIAVVGELGKVAGSLSSGEIQRAITESAIAQRVLAWMSPYVDIQQLQSPELMMERVQGWSGALANRTVGVVGGVLSAVVQTLLVVFTMFYLFRDGDAIRLASYDVLPLERSQAKDIIARTREVIAASVYGVLAISAIQGLLGGIVFWALGLP